MPGDYTRWYRVGTVKATLNSKSVVGTNTYWLSAGLNPGDLFTTTDGKAFTEILSIEDDSHLTLATEYPYDGGSGLPYAICRNFTAHMPSQIAADTAKLIGDMARYWDEDHLTLKGESAYEIALRLGKTTATEAGWINSLKGASAYTVAYGEGYRGTAAEWLESLTAYGVAVSNGYTGTKAQWLESLKAAGEWSTVNSRFTAIESVNSEQENAIATIIARTLGIVNGNAQGSADPAPMHNAIYRGKQLGKFTKAHSDAIRNGTFTDMYLGDYFTTASGDKYGYRIIAFDHFWNWPDKAHHIVVEPIRGLGNHPFNQTDTTEGGYVNSYWRNTLKPQFEEQIAADFIDSSHLWKHREWLVSAVNSDGDATGYVVVTDACVELPDEMQICGFRNQHLNEKRAAGTSNAKIRQFPFYRFQGWGWLPGGIITRTIVSPTNIRILPSGYGNYTDRASHGVNPSVPYITVN